jgi:hypothetical protein
VAKSGAQRNREYRARKSDQRAVAPVEFDTVEHVEKLKVLGFLPRAVNEDAEDFAGAVGRAIRRLLVEIEVGNFRLND